jgi:hypothetical protein
MAPSAEPSRAAPGSTTVIPSDPSSRDLALRLTLLYFVLEPGIHWQARVPVQLLATAGLLVPGWLSSRTLWGFLAVVAGVRLVFLWPHSDNHDYFALYWCLAIVLGGFAPDFGAAVSRSARLLLGCGFALAVVWKAGLSPDFVNGDFFRLALLMDGRFPELARLVGGLTLAAQEANAQFIAGQGGVFTEPPALVLLAWSMTIWTLLVEGLLAGVFLWPDRGGVVAPARERLRNGLLLLFCATTFAIAPVAGFGWLLVAMGVAQCDPARRRVRALYVATFMLILIYANVPWLEFLAGLFAGHQA